jgi:hypothetical protein
VACEIFVCTAGCLWLAIVVCAQGFNALMLAVMHDCHAVVDYLLSINVNINYQKPVVGLSRKEFLSFVFIDAVFNRVDPPPFTSPAGIRMTELQKN